MHIPDGFLDAKTSLATTILACGGLAVALRHARLTLPARKVPLLGLSAAFVFAAQMVNFPVGAGTSGHLLGGTLAAVLLGPSAAVIVLGAVLIVQCLMLADGGITAWGANVFNMAMVGGVVGWMVFEAVKKGLGTMPGMSEKGRLVTAAVVAAWVSTVLSAVACAGELAASGTVAWKLALPAMAGVHAIIGIGEAAITGLALSAIASVRPELVLERGEAMRGGAMKAGMVYGGLITAGLVLFVAPFASKLPDGMEQTAGRLGFLERARETVAGLPANVWTGLLGMVAVAFVMVVLMRVVVKSRQE